MPLYNDYPYLRAVPPCPAGSTAYTVRPGDTFYTLARRLGNTVAAIAALNPGVNPDALQIGQRICVPSARLPQPPVLIPTPLCSLLQPVLSAIPQAADIPVGSVTVRQVAMSTRAYTITASPLPDPAVLGNYDSYVGVLSLITDDPATPRATVNIRLISSTFGTQLPTWAGTIITAYPPILGDTVEIRPLNSITGARGAALLRGNIVPCQR